MFGQSVHSAFIFLLKLRTWEILIFLSLYKYIAIHGNQIGILIVHEIHFFGPNTPTVSRCLECCHLICSRNVILIQLIRSYYIANKISQAFISQCKKPNIH